MIDRVMEIDSIKRVDQSVRFLRPRELVSEG